MIVNADSAQVYRDLPVLSAGPTDADRARADHRLYGMRDGASPCSAADWAEAAKAQIAGIHCKGRLPILVGGTGLYLRTLLEGIAPVPPIATEVRTRVRSRRVEENRAELKKLDPASARRVNAGDSARTARALEVVLSTGRTLSAWQAERVGGLGDEVELRPLVLLPPRQWLYERSDERFVQMLGHGAVEEVKALLGHGLDPSLPVMRAIGVREIASWLAGEIDRDEMVARGQQATRNYAKRQYTWFANQPPPGWPQFTEPLTQATMAEALALLEPSA